MDYSRITVRQTKLGSPGSDFRQLVDLLRIAVCFIDADGKVLVWNKAAEEITGYPREEVVGQDKIWRWLYPNEQYRNWISENVNTIIASRLHEENLEAEIMRNDGETRIVSWNFRGLFDEDDHATGSIALGRDTTEQVRFRKELERRSEHLEELVKQRTSSLSESEERLFAIIQGSPEGIVVTDPNGKITECNQAALQLYGSTSRDRLIGRNLLDLIAVRDREVASNDLAAVARKGTMRHLRYSMLREDGNEYPAESSLSIVRDAVGSPLVNVAIIRDLTEQNEVEERLRKAERMAVIGETVAMVGHDLRNPLQTISGALYILGKKYNSTADQETTDMLGLIESGLEYADNIVKELLDYSREIRLELEETTMKIVTTASLLRVKIPETITVRDLTQDEPRIFVDIPQIQRVLINLTANAIDAMPKGGFLTIESTQIGNDLEIRISDTGGGISEDVMRSLWKPLKTTKSKGMGLGLAICKRIVETHDGSIDVETTTGQGSTFTIRLPLKPKTTTRSINAQYHAPTQESASSVLQ